MLSAARKAACDKGPTPLFVAGLARRTEKEELLGARFVMEDQRVRITSGEHAGRCGVIVQRARLCESDERGCQVIRRPKLDATGRPIITEPQQLHTLLIDTDESGAISPESFVGVVASLGFPREQAEALAAATDTDGDGAITFGEFSALLSKVNQQARRITPLPRADWTHTPYPRPHLDRGSLPEPAS